MKLNGLFFKDKKPQLPPMMPQEQIQADHDLLVAIVTGQTPIRFTKLKKGSPNPIQMMAEVFAYILKLEHGKSVENVVQTFRKQLADFAAQQKHNEEQAKIVNLIQKGYEGPDTPAIITPPNNGAA